MSSRSRKCAVYKSTNFKEMPGLWRSGSKKALMTGNKTWTRSVNERLVSLNLT
jgi:hypothetical protein